MGDRLLKREVEVITNPLAGIPRTVPSRRALRYLAWPSRSILVLSVTVVRKGEGGELHHARR